MIDESAFEALERQAAELWERYGKPSEFMILAPCSIAGWYKHVAGIALKVCEEALPRRTVMMIDRDYLATLDALLLRGGLGDDPLLLCNLDAMGDIGTGLGKDGYIRREAGACRMLLAPVRPCGSAHRNDA